MGREPHPHTSTSGHSGGHLDVDVLGLGSATAHTRLEHALLAGLFAAQLRFECLLRALALA